MKIFKNIVLVIVFLASVFILYLFSNYLNSTVFAKYYNFPTEAVIKKYHATEVKTVEDKGIAVVLFKEKTYTIRYMVKSEKGWSFPFENVNLDTREKSIGEYTLFYNKINGKYIFDISASSLVTDFKTPTDSINSEFQFLNTNIDNTELKNCVLILDNLPENYKINVNGREVAIKDFKSLRDYKLFPPLLIFLSVLSLIGLFFTIFIFARILIMYFKKLKQQKNIDLIFKRLYEFFFWTGVLISIFTTHLYLIIIPFVLSGIIFIVSKVYKEFSTKTDNTTKTP